MLSGFAFGAAALGLPFFIAGGIKLVYDVAPGTKGDHIHIYVDGEQTALLRQFKGTYTVDKLTAGKHWLCIRVIDKGNTPVGLEKCVGVLAGNVPPMGY